MKKVFSILMVAVVSTMAMASCGGGNAAGGSDNDTPSSVMEKFNNYLVKKQYAKAMDLLWNIEQASDADYEKTSKWYEKELEEKGGIKSFDILSETIAESGKKAKVEVRYTYGNGKVKERTHTLMKTENGWRVTLF